jgi:hypothetical protein
MRIGRITIDNDAAALPYVQQLLSQMEIQKFRVSRDFPHSTELTAIFAEFDYLDGASLENELPKYEILWKQEADGELVRQPARRLD